MKTETIPRQFADQDIVALAWLIIGEGYVSLCADYNRAKYPGVSQFRLQLIINMVDPEPLRYMQSVFGGNLRPYNHANERWSSFWRLVWPTDKAIELLKLIYPHLRGTKKRQAALAFKFRKIAKQARWKRDSHRFKLLLKIVKEMRTLTNRGRQPKAVETVRPDLLVEDMIQSELASNGKNDGCEAIVQ